MDKVIKERENHMANWKKMPIEDKILAVMEGFCYLSVLGALIAVVFAINKGSVLGSGLLIFSAAGLIACGLEAKKSRDSYMGKRKLSIRNNKKEEQTIKMKLSTKLFN